MNVSRGQLVRVQLDPARGSEERKTRPCVVVQRDAANRAGRTTLVCPLTDAAGKQASLIRIAVPAGAGGATKDSLVLCAQLRVVDQVRVVGELGSLPHEIMERVNAGLRVILDL